MTSLDMVQNQYSLVREKAFVRRFCGLYIGILLMSKMLGIWFVNIFGVFYIRHPVW